MPLWLPPPNGRSNGGIAAPVVLEAAEKLEQALKSDQFLAGKQGWLSCVDACFEYMLKHFEPSETLTRAGWDLKRQLRVGIGQESNAHSMTRVLSKYKYPPEMPELAELDEFKLNFIKRNLHSSTQNKATDPFYAPETVVNPTFDRLFPALLKAYVQHAHNGTYTYEAYEALWQAFAEEVWPHTSPEERTAAKLRFLRLQDQPFRLNLFKSGDIRYKLDCFDFFMDTVARERPPIDTVLKLDLYTPEPIRSMLSQAHKGTGALWEAFLEQKMRENPFYATVALLLDTMNSYVIKDGRLKSQMYWDFDTINQWAWSKGYKFNNFYHRFSKTGDLEALLPSLEAKHQYKGTVAFDTLPELLDQEVLRRPMWEMNKQAQMSQVNQWMVHSTLRQIEKCSSENPMFARWIAEYDIKGSKSKIKKIEKYLFDKADRHHYKHSTLSAGTEQKAFMKLRSAKRQALVRNALLQTLKNRLTQPLSVTNSAQLQTPKSRNPRI